MGTGWRPAREISLGAVGPHLCLPPSLPLATQRRCLHAVLREERACKRGLHDTASRVCDESPKEKKKQTERQQTLTAWLIDQVLHLWHGFRLLVVNTRITLRLKRQMLAGQKLTRRERQLLERTTQDLLCLVPFSVFIIVPGAELLLPIALALFPNLMPSTFTTSDQRRKKQIMDNLQVGTARRRVLEYTLSQIVWYENVNTEPETLQAFQSMKEGAIISEEEIRRLTKYFDDEGPLALRKLPYYLLRDLCRQTGTLSRVNLLLPRSWRRVRMRYALDQELERRAADDKNLSRTVLSSLTPQELEHECVLRGMQWFGHPEALQRQLKEWLSLSLDPDVPNHMMLFLRPCATPHHEMMQYLSKEERKHILGLEQFRDTFLYTTLKSVTQQAKGKSEETLQKSLMQDNLDELKDRVKEAKEEDRACAQQLADVRDALKEVTDDDLFALFERLVEKTPQQDSDGAIGVNTEVLGKGLVEFAFGGSHGVGGCASQRYLDVLREFDIDHSDVISHSEFKSFVSRIRSNS